MTTDNCSTVYTIAFEGDRSCTRERWKHIFRIGRIYEAEAHVIWLPSVFTCYGRMQAYVWLSKERWDRWHQLRLETFDRRDQSRRERFFGSAQVEPEYAAQNSSSHAETEKENIIQTPAAPEAPTASVEVAQPAPSGRQSFDDGGATLPADKNSTHATHTVLSTGDQREAQPVGKADHKTCPECRGSGEYELPYFDEYPFQVTSCWLCNGTGSSEGKQ